MNDEFVIEVPRCQAMHEVFCFNKEYDVDEILVEVEELIRHECVINKNEENGKIPLTEPLTNSVNKDSQQKD